MNMCLHDSSGLTRSSRSRTTIVLLCTLALLLASLFPAQAQESGSAPITADDVNAVAREMYCPVCENIPLDVCPTEACRLWREEIRDQLIAGKTVDEIKLDFVARYGDRVLGTPQDPMLRTLSLVTPWVIGALAVIATSVLLIRWWRTHRTISSNPASAEETISDQDYRARLEHDLLTRR